MEELTRVAEDLAGEIAGLPGVVFQPSAVGDGWDEVRAEMLLAFEATRWAFDHRRPVVYLLHTDDLLGRRGIGAAMLAGGLLSAARTAAVEGVREGIRVNVLSTEDGVEPAVVARWCRLLLEGDGPTGEVVRIGPGHLGKALP